MTKYIYDRNRCYMGETERTDATRNVTDVKPPKCKKGEVAVFSGNNWIKLEDNRRKVMFNKSSAVSVPVSQPGPIPKGWTLDESEVDKVALEAIQIKDSHNKIDEEVTNKYPLEYQVKVALGIIEDPVMIKFMTDAEVNKTNEAKAIKAKGNKK